MRYSLNLPADARARDTQVVMRILHDAVASHGVRRPVFSAPSLVRPVDLTDGHLTLGHHSIEKLLSIGLAGLRRRVR